MFARYGKWSAEAKAAYDPDGTADFATMVSRANDDFGQAEPARFAASAFAANGSPVYLYRFSYVADFDEGTDAGGRAARRRNRLCVRHAIGRPRRAPSTEDLAVSRMAQSYWVNFAKTGDPNGTGLPTWPRHDAGKDLIFDFRPDGTAGAGPDSRKARLDVTAEGHRVWKARRFKCRSSVMEDGFWNTSTKTALLAFIALGVATGVMTRPGKLDGSLMERSHLERPASAFARTTRFRTC